jgi:hypothetical protein
MFSWCKLNILEHRLYWEFGKYNQYRRLCLEQNAKTSKDKLRIVQEVWNGSSVNVCGAWANEIYLRKGGIKP